MRTDLPTCSDAVYSPKQILLFDNYRAGYKQMVAFFDECLITTTPDAKYINDTNYSDHLNTISIWHPIVSNKSLLTLRKQTPTDQITHNSTINHEYDIITAFYVPTNLDWMQIQIGNRLTVEWSGQPKLLEELLAVAQILPRPNDDILDLALTDGHMGYIHKCENVITLDGISYTRVDPIQPFLPMVLLLFDAITVTTSSPNITFWTEGTILNRETKTKLYLNEKIIFIENQLNPICTIIDGMFVPVRIGLDDQPIQMVESSPAIPNILTLLSVPVITATDTTVTNNIYTSLIK